MARAELKAGQAVHVQPTGGSEDGLDPRNRYGRIVGVDRSPDAMGRPQKPVYAVQGVRGDGGLAYFLVGALRPVSGR